MITCYFATKGESPFIKIIILGGKGGIFYHQENSLSMTCSFSGQLDISIELLRICKCKRLKSRK